MAENMICHACENQGFDCIDGFYYCRRCGSQAEDMAETGVADEDFVDKGNNQGAIYSLGHRRIVHAIKSEPINLISQSETQDSQFWRTLTQTQTLTGEFKTPKEQEEDDVKPSVPCDFGGGAVRVSSLSSEDFSSEIRARYILGIQFMVQFQCKALVEKFGVSPLICGLAGVIWLRFVAVSRVFDEGWADQIVEDSEVQRQGDSKIRQPKVKFRSEPHNIHGERAVMIWFRYLRKRIPISSSLAVTFLACHIAREAILPTDIVKWSLEGQIPYLNSFVDIEKCFGRPSSACPLSSSFMFRPFQVLGSKELESQAGFVAQQIGLHLPSVNFYAIGRRYLEQLSLPVEKILPHASRIYEWLMPPDLWLSANRHRLPTRVCVMSILMVAIRILYNINGFGKWEAMLSSSGVSSSSSCHQVEKSISPSKPGKKIDDVKRCSPSGNLHEMGTRTTQGASHIQTSEFDTAQLLAHLETTYYKICDTQEYSKDLPTYLKFCNDVVFSGLTTLLEDNEEEKIIDQLWKFYEKQEDSEAGTSCSRGSSLKRPRDEECVPSVSMGHKKPRGEGFRCSATLDEDTLGLDDRIKRSLDRDGGCSSPQEDQILEPGGGISTGSLKEKSLRRLKSNMEENMFCYIPPRVNPKRFDYLHYVRKNDGGSRSYVAHADYYILLRACARVAQVDARYMHAGMLKLEKRLAWTENRIDQSLHVRCQNPSPESNDHHGDPSQDLDDSLDFRTTKL